MRFRNTILLAALMGLVMVGPANAGIIFDWDPAFGWVEPGGATPSNIPAGHELKFVGDITDIGPPLDFLDPSDPGVEYTFYVYGLISTGTVTAGPVGTQFYTTNFNGGFIEIYEDNTPDFVYTPNPPNADVPSKFTDGTLILSGQFTRFVVETNNFTAYQVGHAEGDIVWTGGSLFPTIAEEVGDECPGLFTGGLTWRPEILIDGYMFRHDGKIDLNCPREADIDIHPTSCPNPFNPNTNGLLPVAILGTDSFDITNIEMGTILLEGIPPFKVAIGDVSQPVPNQEDVCDCSTLGPDGYDDLLLKFKVQDLLAVLGPIQDGDELVLTLTGNYIINGSQTTFEGQDCIRINAGGGGGETTTAASLRVVSLAAGGSTARVDFSLSQREHVRIDVVDVTGRSVARLANGWQDAGSHSLQWNAGGLPSGVYFVRMESAERTLNAKHVIAR